MLIGLQRMKTYMKITAQMIKVGKSDTKTLPNQN